MKSVICLFLGCLLAGKCFATFWGFSLPYHQSIEGQQVRIEAIPYIPSSHLDSSAKGLTKVFFKKKLLYTIDRYYGEMIFPSDDGQYLAIFHQSLMIDEKWENEQSSHDYPVIEILKNGLPYKTFSLQEVVETPRIINYGLFYSWLPKFPDYTLEQTKRERKIAENRFFVQNNALHIITDQNSVTVLHFDRLTLEHVDIEEIVSNAKSSRPPKTIRKFIKNKYPDLFMMPRLKGGMSFEKAVSKFLRRATPPSLTLPSDSFAYPYFRTTHKLIINKQGNCIAYDGWISKNEKVNKQFKIWIMAQRFQTRLIPRGFDNYYFFALIATKVNEHSRIR